MLRARKSRTSSAASINCNSSERLSRSSNMSGLRTTNTQKSILLRFTCACFHSLVVGVCAACTSAPALLASSLLASCSLCRGKLSGRSVLVAAAANAVSVALLCSGRRPASSKAATSCGSVTLAIAMSRRLRLQGWSWHLRKPYDCDQTSAADQTGKDARGHAEAALAQRQVIGSSALRVLEHVVGGNDLPETLLGNLVAGIEVGVVGFGSPAESRPDRLVVRMTRNAKNVIGCLHGLSLKRIAVACLALRRRDFGSGSGRYRGHPDGWKVRPDF